MPNNLIAFTASGTYTPPAGVTSVDVLVVGGGGAGGGSDDAGTGGGGGGGGVTYQTVTVTPGTPVTVTVGAGGTPPLANVGNQGGDGGASAFGAVSVFGGGGGGGSNSRTGRPGGSGGGGGATESSGGSTGGAGTAGQGTNGAGGNGANFGNNNGGGGGGASVAGSGAQGGAGISYVSTFGTTYGVNGLFAGGGSGGVHNGGAPGGGSGGGGRGASGGTPAGAGTPNTGGGGGGTQRGVNPAGAGGSGVVLVLEPLPTADTSYDDEVLADTPAIYLRMGENIGSVLDSSGNSRPGTVSGTEVRRNVTGLIAGDSNGAIQFLANGSGSSGVVNVPYGAWMDTINAWDVLVRPRTVTGTVLSRDDGTNRVFQLGILNQKAFLKWWNADGSGPTTITGATTIGLNKPAYVGFTLDGTGTYRLHVNGTVDATSAAGQSVRSAIAPLRIGAQADASATSKFDGILDEVAGYAVAPSTARMNAHWVAAGSPVTLTDALLSGLVSEVAVAPPADIRLAAMITQVALVVGEKVATSGSGGLSGSGIPVVPGVGTVSGGDGDGGLTAEGHRVSTVGPQLIPDPGQLMDLLWLRVPDHYRQADEALDWPMFRYLAGVVQVLSEPYTLLNRIDYKGLPPLEED